jgi:hypothetical protein
VLGEPHRVPRQGSFPRYELLFVPIRGKSMSDDIIRDPSTGHQVAYADASGKVRDVNTNEVVAFVIEGNLYSTYGEFLGHLESSDNVQSKTAPEAFMKLLRKSK